MPKFQLIYTIKVTVPADNVERIQFLLDEFEDDKVEVANVETMEVEP